MEQLYLEYQGDIDDIPRMPGTRERFGILETSVSRTPLHYHDYAEISYFTGGSGVETINGICHSLQAGTVSFLLPNHMHTIQSAPDQFVRKYCCMFDVQLLFGYQEDGEFSRLLHTVGTELPSFGDFTGSEQETMQSIFQSLLALTHETQTPVLRHMIRTKLTEAVLLFLRSASHNQSVLKSPNATQTFRQTQLFWPVLRHVHVHYREPISLEELAQRFHLSVSYISLAFKKYTGSTFVKYIHQLRVESAVNMLRHTTISVTDIAHEVGFASFRTFARVFREIKGVTAKEFRGMLGAIHG
ncbi:AraC family transcriptional regulator [Paenibacillus koleovorans]|uniref:AraC family transcriptional regulator n=1 Tax=Paenibacillus koleovorans TaxID=121608 RepID=UPI000FD9EA55|nr:AraC family transcriptional regulator [Paenibacillus koleovorans]